MKYYDFYELLKSNRLTAPIWKLESDLINEELNDIEKKDDYINLFQIYFSLICSGNVCMSLEEDKLSTKWLAQIEGAYNQLHSDEKPNEEYEEKYKELVAESNRIIKKQYLDSIKDLNIVSIVNDNSKIFEIDNNFLYLRKYYLARIGIRQSIDRLFKPFGTSYKPIPFNDYIDKKNQLSDGQLEVISKGLNNNLVVTGGPGTGKTTSILYLLLNILSNDNNYGIYLAAMAGKAAGRMKDSLKSGIDKIKKNPEILKLKGIQEAIEKISGLIPTDDKKVEEFTIHRLLKLDRFTNKFTYNKNNQFDSKSIFIIDEASMIDLCLFNNLLDAIPEGAHVFILGDKDQLPSVDVGAVFSELLQYVKEENKVTIKKSQRFLDGTDIAEFAKKVNTDGADLELDTKDFKDPLEFKEVYPIEKDKYPIYYYQAKDSNREQEKSINSILKIWVKKFFIDSNIVKDSMNLDKDNIKAADLEKIFNYTLESKILCAENDGVRGVNTINRIIKRMIYDNETIKKISNISLSNNYIGQIMMINSNNKSLDLFNGDMGMLVSFKDDKTLYLMVNKKTNLNLSNNRETDKIFKIEDFIFYPFRLITSTEIDLAYAITVHKSQGSDYKNIFVILPTQKGHPLLNRQILYTAITRTKGNTYILSTKERLEEAHNRRLIRDTNIN